MKSNAHFPRPYANLSREVPRIPSVSAITLQTIVIPNRLQPVRNLLFCPLARNVRPPHAVILRQRSPWQSQGLPTKDLCTPQAAP